LKKVILDWLEEHTGLFETIGRRGNRSGAWQKAQTHNVNFSRRTMRRKKRIPGENEQRDSANETHTNIEDFTEKPRIVKKFEF